MNDRRTLFRRLAGFLLFAGFAALVVSYYLFHKPLTPSLVLSLTLALLRVVLVSWVVLAAGGLGRRLLPVFGEDPLARLAMQAALGFGCLGLAWLGIGAAGGLHPLIAWGFLVALTVLVRGNMRHWLRDWSALAGVWAAAGRFGRFLLGASAALLFLALLPALAPPIAYDALVYHLALPQQYIGAGRFIYVPGIMFWGMPQTGEMLYTWGMLLGGAPAAALLGWSFGLLACAGVLGLARTLLPADSALVGLSALLAGSSLVTLLGAAYVDWLAILFGVAWLAALFAFSLVDAPRARLGLAALAGVCAGFALGTKYTAGVLLLCSAAVIAWQNRRSPAALLKELFVFGLAGVLVFTPWLLKNWFFTGNPVYPFLFPSGAMTATRLRIYQGGRPFGDWRDVIFLPWRATLLGTEGGPGYTAAIGPLLFGLGLCAVLPVGALSPQRRRLLQTAALAALAGVVVWMIAGRFSSYLLQSRLYLAFFPALAVLAGAGFHALGGLAIPGVRLGRVSAALVLVVVSLNLMEAIAGDVRAGPVQTILGMETSFDYRGRNLGQYAVAAQAMEARLLPPDAKVVMLWETRSFDCYPACQPDEVLDRWQRERYPTPGAAPRSPRAILEGWRAAGITHLLVYVSGAEFIRQQGSMGHRPEDWAALDELLAMLPQPQSFGSAYRLYRLTP